MNIKLRFIVSVVLAIFCALILGIGAETAPVAHAAADYATGAQPAKHYNSPQWFAPDGKSHQFWYDIPCSGQAKAEGKQCWVVITVTATTSNKPVPAPEGAVVYSRSLSPYVNTYNETITNDYQTCTGWFGSCGDYTDGKLVVNVNYGPDISTEMIWMHQYCSAYNWTCQGVASTSDYYGGLNGDLYMDYGPQLYQSTINSNQQTKWVETEVNNAGKYWFHNTCSGALC